MALEKQQVLTIAFQARQHVLTTMAVLHVNVMLVMMVTVLRRAKVALGVLILMSVSQTHITVTPIPCVPMMLVLLPALARTVGLVLDRSVMISMNATMPLLMIVPTLLFVSISQAFTHVLVLLDTLVMETFVPITTNASMVPIIVIPMQRVLIPRDLSTVHAMMVSRAMVSLHVTVPLFLLMSVLWELIIVTSSRQFAKTSPKARVVPRNFLVF